MILTDDDNLADQCRELRNLCFKPGKRFEHERMGWNFRMTNLQAALGLAQLEQLDAFIEKKRWIGQRYNELFSDLESTQLPLTKTDFADNIYWVYGLVVAEKSAYNADSIIKKLANLGIGCRPFFYPLHLQPVLRNLGLFEDQEYPVSERISQFGFYVPSGLAIDDSQIVKVANSTSKVIEECFKN